MSLKQQVSVVLTKPSFFLKVPGGYCQILSPPVPTSLQSVTLLCILLVPSLLFISTDFQCIYELEVIDVPSFVWKLSGGPSWDGVLWTLLPIHVGLGGNLALSEGHRVWKRWRVLVHHYAIHNQLRQIVGHPHGNGGEQALTAIPKFITENIILISWLTWLEKRQDLLLSHSNSELCHLCPKTYKQDSLSNRF